MELYKEGTKLEENQYLLKIRPADKYKNETGFLTKFNKDGSIPKAFKEWGKYWADKDKDSLPTYIFEETFRKGWKLEKWRFGMSQNWATVIHPEGFTVEIYLQDFLNIAKNNTIEKGEIIGEFKWEAHKLIKK
jgi:hypothetical protein